MNAIHLQCSQLQTALYLRQAMQLSLPHNPGRVFTLTCDRRWHSSLEYLFGIEERISIVSDDFIGACDFDFLLGKQLASEDQSIPRMFIKCFRLVAEYRQFTSALNTEQDLILPLTHRYVATARILFVNEPNRCVDKSQMDCLIQSVSDRRFSIIATQETRAGHAQWQAGRDIADYAAIAAQCDYVIGPACAIMAACFNSGSINRCRGWFVLDAKHTFPFNDRCHSATTWQEAINLLKQHELI